MGHVELHGCEFMFLTLRFWLYAVCSVCWHGLNGRHCDASQLYVGKCYDGDTRQWFAIEDLGTSYSGGAGPSEVLIKTVTERCLYREESAIYTSPVCDPDDMRQRFFALNGSFVPTPLNRSGFEIGQYQGYTLDNCITVRKTVIEAWYNAFCF
jgi:hypothetical protein